MCVADVTKLKQRIAELERRNRELALLLESAQELQQDGAQTPQAFAMSVIHSLVLALDSRDPYTAGHSSRVAIYSLWTARKLGMPEQECRTFHQIALMHDIGKIGVPDHVLLKDGALDEEEFRIMSSHTTIGARILSKMEPKERRVEATAVAKYHHEKMDGTGYPEGLKGEQIPYLARIVAVADAFDAMTTDRPYSKGRSYFDGVQELIRCKGTHFDPAIVDAFAAVMEQRRYLAEATELDVQDEGL